MNLLEANERLSSPITEKQLCEITPLYLLLDLHKDYFCKIVNAVGIEILLDKQKYFERLSRAERELTAKEEYLYARERLVLLDAEKEDLERIVEGYNPYKIERGK